MSSESWVARNTSDACCDVGLATDAVPDHGKTRRKYDNEKQPKPPNEDLIEENPLLNTSDCSKPTYQQSSCNKPSPRTKETNRPRPRPVPRCLHQPQGQGVSYVTYNISNTRNVQIGNKYMINITPSGTSSKYQSSSPMKETKEIQKLLQSSEPITLDDISTVSTHVGITWKEMGRLLNYTGGQLDQFDADHGREGLKEVVYQLLLDWKQVNTTKATVGILCSALKSSHQRDAVNEWAKKRST